MSYPSIVFLVLILLLLGHPRSYERRLLQLSSAINATRNSLRSLNVGMDSLQAGMHQISPAALPETAPPIEEVQAPDPQTIKEEEEIITANLSLV